MASVQQAMKAKSDQLNFIDISDGSEPILHVESVVVTNSDQPIAIHYVGCNGRPYKPAKCMIRVLAGAWGDESDLWVGKYIKVFGDPTVTWAGAEQGGIRIRALSDIPKQGYTAFIQKNRSTRVKQTIPYLDMSYPTELFKEKLPAMKTAIEGGMSVEDVIARCSQTGILSDEQIKELKGE